MLYKYISMTQTISNIIKRNDMKISGRGTRPLIFAHGFGCDQNMWRFVAPAFEDDYKVVVFDYVGSGKSNHAAYDMARYSTLTGYSKDVTEICTALELSDAIFVGHSVSCMIGVLAHLRNPAQITNLILIGPSPRYINDPPHYHGGFEASDIDGMITLMEQNYREWAKYLAPVVMKNADKPELINELETSFCSTDPLISRNFAHATFYGDNREDVRKIKAPTLILQCKDDSIAPLEVGHFLRDNIPNNTFKQMEAEGHCPHLSHPEETTQLIKEYLRST